MAGNNLPSANNCNIGAMFIGGSIKKTNIQNNVQSTEVTHPDQSTADLRPGEIRNSNLGAVFAGVKMDEVTITSDVNKQQCHKQGPWDTVIPNEEGLYTFAYDRLPEPTSNSNEAYKMDSHPYKGAAFIVNNSYFPKLKNPERTGSVVDVNNAKKLWKSYGFYVKVAENKSTEEIMDELTDFLALDRVTKTDCVVVMLMSHGGEGVLYGTDKMEVHYSDIFSLFQPNNCPKLKDKPKIFFIQACRGTQVEVGVDAKPGPSSSQNSPIDDREEGIGGENHPSPFEKCLRTPLPADFYIAHSTCDGFYSLRDGVNGSYFVQALCEVFYPRAPTEDLSSLMTKVSEKVSQRLEFVKINKERRCIMQQPQIHSTLRKKVYFKPNLNKTV